MESILPWRKKKAGAIPDKTGMAKTEMHSGTADAEKAASPLESKNKPVTGQMSQPIPATDEVAIVEPEAPIQEVVSGPPFVEKISDGGETEATQDKLDVRTIFSGNIELALDAPVDLHLLSQLYDTLLTIPQLRILRTSGSLTRGARIKIILEKPMPLFGNLSTKIPDIQAEEIISENKGKFDGKLKYGFKGEDESRTIKIVLKNNISA